jgi:hypothetical protein
VFVQFEDASVVESQTFPNRVAALHGGIERTNASLIAMYEPPVDIYDQIAILLVKLLEHEKTEGLIRKREKQEKKEIKLPALPEFLLS